MSSTFINVKDFGAKGNGINDDTDYIKLAVEAANAIGGAVVFFPPGTYIINGAKNASSYPGVNYGIPLFSKIKFLGSGWSSVLKLADNSTANTNVNPHMFFAGPSGALSGIAFESLAFHGNSLHNRLQVGDQRIVAAIHIGGIDDGQGVFLDGLQIHHCLFTDWPGANVVLVHDRRMGGSFPFSRNVLIAGNTFHDNRKDANNRDHSTINIFADNTRVVNNLFSIPWTATKLQKQLACACELHGSASCFNSNTLEWYAAACIFSQNLHHDCTTQSAIGNVCSNMTYRVFDIAVSAFDSKMPRKFKTINQINVTGNNIHFNTVEPIEPGYGAPFKWALSFYIVWPFVVNSVTFANNIVDGDTLQQKIVSVAFDPVNKPNEKVTLPVTTIGVAGLWDGGGDSYWGLTNLNVISNQFRRMRYGVWQDCLNLATIAKHSSIVGNRFEDLADPTLDPSATAVAIYYTSNGAQPGIKSVNIAQNHFVNDWDRESYKYGTYIDNTIFFPAIGENWYHQIKVLDNGWGPMSTAAVISRSMTPNAIFTTYGPTITIDWGLANRFFIIVTNNSSFTINTPNINGTAPTPADGTEIEVTIRNVSGGSIGNLTWEVGYRTSWNNSVDKPANGFNRTLRFRYSRALALWVETSKTNVDVPN